MLEDGLWLLQGLLCGVLQVVIQKLAEQDSTKVTVLQYADQIMAALLRVFNSRHATVHEEAMLAVGALTYACGPQFSKYMGTFYSVLEMGLQQHLVCFSPHVLLHCNNQEDDLQDAHDAYVLACPAHLHFFPEGFAALGQILHILWSILYLRSACSRDSML